MEMKLILCIIDTNGHSCTLYFGFTITCLIVFIYFIALFFVSFTPIKLMFYLFSYFSSMSLTDPYTCAQDFRML